MVYSYSHTPLLLVALARNDNVQWDQRDEILDTVLNYSSTNQSDISDPDDFLALCSLKHVELGFFSHKSAKDIAGFEDSDFDYEDQESFELVLRSNIVKVF